MALGGFRQKWNSGIWLAPYLGLLVAAGGCGREDAPEPENPKPRQQVNAPGDIADPGADGNDQPAAPPPAQVLPGKEVELEALDDNLSEEEVRRIFKEIATDFDVDAFGDISEHKQRAAEAPPSPVNSMRQAVYNAVFMGRLHKATEASFRISGTITSDEGLPLTNVDVEVTKYGMMGGKTGAESMPTGDDATFSIECDGAGRIEMLFKKQGHYDETFVFESGFELDQQKAQGLLTKAPLPKIEVVEDQLEVVLAKQGTLTQLARGAGWLQFSTTKKYKGFDLDRIDMFSSSDRGLVEISDLAEFRTNVLNGIYITVAQDAEGDIETFQELRWHFPARVTLHYTGEEGGFVPFVPNEDADHAPPLPRQMKKAPEAGYVPEFTSIRGDNQLRYFYFKAGGKYGRGELSQSKLTKDRQTATVLLILYIQPDGSRNLETGL